MGNSNTHSHNKNNTQNAHPSNPKKWHIRRRSASVSGSSENGLNHKPKSLSKKFQTRKTKSRARSVDTINIMQKQSLQTQDFLTRFEKMQQTLVNTKELKLSSSQIPKNRVVFVSTLGLYQSWKYIPSCVLKDCILLLQCKKEWVYNSKKFIGNYQSIITLIGASSNNEFLTMLKWKDSQNLVFWMYDSLTDWALTFEKQIETKHERYQMLRALKKEENENFSNLDSFEFESLCDELRISHNRFDNNHRACAFWRYFSIELTKLYDPIKKSNYLPLVIDERWWQNKYNFSLSHCTQYGCMPKQVVEQLRGAISPKYKTVMELIYQSNPSLLLVTNYNQIGSEIRGIRGLLTPVFETVSNICTNNKITDNDQINNNNKINENEAKSRRHSCSTVLTSEDLANVMVDAEWHENDSVSTWISVDYDPNDTDSEEEEEENSVNTSHDDSDIKCVF